MLAAVAGFAIVKKSGRSGVELQLSVSRRENPYNCFPANTRYLHRYDKISIYIVSDFVGSRTEQSVRERASRLHYTNSAKFATAYLMLGALLGFRSSVASAATRGIPAQGTGFNAESSNFVHRENLFFGNAVVSVRPGLKIEGLEQSNALPSDNSSVEHHLSSNHVSGNVHISEENLVSGAHPADSGITLRKTKEQVQGKLSEFSQWWKDTHEIYRQDTAAWGYGTNPIFTVYEGPDGRIRKVTIDEKEIQRRVGVEPLFLSSADESSKAQASERVTLAKTIANDIEMGNTKPRRNSTIFAVVKHRTMNESHHKYEKFLNQIVSLAYTAAPLIRSTFLVVVPIYGICVLLGAYRLLSKRSRDDIKKDEDSVARLAKMRKLKVDLDRRKDSRSQDKDGSKQEPANASDFMNELEEVRRMARQVRCGEELQGSLEAEAQGCSTTVLKDQTLRHSSADGTHLKVPHSEIKTQVPININNDEIYTDDSLEDLKGSIQEDGTVTLENEQKNAITDLDRSAANGSVQALALDHQRRSPDSLSKPSFRIKPRIIMSPEEARVTIAAKKAREKGTSTKNGISDGNALNSIVKHHLVGDLPAAGSIANEQSENCLNQTASSSVDSGTSNSGAEPTSDKTMEPPNKGLQRREEGRVQAGWLFPHINEAKDVGKAEVEGQERRHKLERKRVVEDGVENANERRYGIGVDDSPEEHLRRRKDFTKAVRSPSVDRLKEGSQEFPRDQMRVPPSPSFPSSSNSGNFPSSRTSSSSCSLSHDSVVKGSDEEVFSKSQKSLNKLASSANTTVVVGSGQPLRKRETFKNTKRWGKELQKRYDSERNPEIRELMKEIGSDLDSWVTEDEIEEAGRLAQKILEGEEESVIEQYKKVQEKIKEQKQRFGLEAVLNKYKEYQPEAEDELWWLDLNCVLGVLVISKDLGGGGLYSLDMTLDAEGLSSKPAKHVVAFEDQKDAKSFCHLLELRSDSKFQRAEVCPFSPKQLYRTAKDEGFKVTVLKRGQIQANVDQTLDEVQESILEIGRQVYWKRLERERSLDVDSILDQGFGL